MRELKHPTALFVVAVLFVIGIGVGIVSLNPLPPVYGPAGGTFTADFPPPVVTTVVCEPRCAPGIPKWLAYQTRRGAWMATVAVLAGTNDESFTVDDVLWLKSIVGNWRNDGLSGLQTQFLMSGSLRITRLTSHSLLLSGIAEIVNGRQATWIMQTEGPPRPVLSFSSSFQPIG